MASLGNPKHALTGTLAVTTALLLVSTAWSFVSLVQGLSQQGVLLRRQALIQGRDMEHRAAAREHVQPADATLLRPDGDPDSLLFPKQAALVQGPRTLWSMPPYAPPAVTLPPGKPEAVLRNREVWVYARRLGEDRLFLAAFESPAYDRMKDRFLLLAVFESSAAGALILFWAILAWKFRRAYTRISGSLEEAGSLLPGAPPASSVQAVAGIFQSTVAALKRRTEELEGLHRRERQRLEEVEDLAEALCANLEAGYLRFDQEGRLSGLNREARLLLGLVEIPRLGDRADSLLAGSRDLLDLFRTMRGGREVLTRDEVAGAPGLSLQALALPLFNTMGQVKGHLLILRDETARYAMARTLREREALSRLGETAAGVAHEVRNALGAMTANLRLLRGDRPDLLSDRHFQALSGEIEALEGVVKSLLEFARPLPLKIRQVPLGPLVQDAADQAREAFPSVRVECSARGSTLSADPDALGRALLNLVRNAAQAALRMPGREPRVLVIAEVAGAGGASIRVADSGPGLPDAIEDLFTPFVSDSPGGTGLGLAIARKIAREHGGDLEAGGPSPLGGATFVLTIPGGKPGSS